MVTLTNLPKRCVSVSSSQEGSCNTSVASSSEGENPLMTLVDAAASILDKKADKKEDDESMSCPTVEESTGIAATPVSPLTTSKIPLAVEVKVTSPPPALVHVTSTSSIRKDDNKKQTFAELLMSILDDPAHQEVLCWMPDGKAFTIRNHKKFTMDLMPKLFNIRNMSSFVRKLGRWGFCRQHEKETRNSDIFKHKNFQRGDWELCKTVKCVGRLQAKPTPSSPNKAVIDLVAMQNRHPVSPGIIRGSPSLHMSPRRIPSPPALVTPTSDKAMLRLEHARRLSAHSRPSAFRGKGFGNMTNEVVEAAIETLRRDEETVIVSMPKKYLQSHRGPPPGVRVLSTHGGSFAPPTSYPVKKFSRSSFVRHVHHARPAPVTLNTRPTNSGAAAHGPMMPRYATAPKGWPMGHRGSYHAPPAYRR